MAPRRSASQCASLKLVVLHRNSVRSSMSLRKNYLLACLTFLCPLVLAAPAFQPQVKSSPDLARALFKRDELDTTTIDNANFDPAFDPYMPRPSATSLQPDVPYTDIDPDDVLWTPTVYRGRIVTESKVDNGGLPGVTSDADLRPQPVRGDTGAVILGPENLSLELQNADALAPPYTDNGKVSNFKWPFSLSHNKLKKGGWARQQNGELTDIFSVFFSYYLQLMICPLRRKLLVSLDLSTVTQMPRNRQRCQHAARSWSDQRDALAP